MSKTTKIIIIGNINGQPLLMFECSTILQQQVNFYILQSTQGFSTQTMVVVYYRLVNSVIIFYKFKNGSIFK